jgi:hypothetical protein
MSSRFKRNLLSYEPLRRLILSRLRMFWRHWPKHGILLFFDVNECLANGQRLENPARMTKYFIPIASLIKRKTQFCSKHCYKI